MFWAGFATGLGAAVIAATIAYIGFNIWIFKIINR